MDATLRQSAASRTFLDVGQTSLSFGALNDRIARLFTYLSQCGHVLDDRVGILANDPVDVAPLVLGAMRYGLGTVVINPEFTQAEVERACRACGLTHLFRQADLVPAFSGDGELRQTVFAPAGNGGRLPGLLGRFRKNGASATPTLTQIVQGHEPSSPPPSPPGDAILLMLATSGTTSVPKVVELTHDNITAQFAAFDDVYDYGTESRILNPLPLHFTDGLFHGPLAAAVYGSTLFRPKKFEFGQLEDLVNGVYRNAITHFIVVPAILSLMDRLGSEFTDTFDGADFRYIRSSGDRLPAELWRSIEERFGVRVVNTYGMSETVCEAFYCGPGDDLFRFGTIGRAVGCEWRIVDEEGRPVGSESVGELLLKGPIIMPGYRNQPALTAAAMTDGWLRTGDLATASQDGFVTIVGRKKDLVISGGVNIHPQEITDCLLAHPAVADAFAFGQPHSVWGEQVVAAVVCRGGEALEQTDLIEHCQSQLAQHKVPRLILFMDELPRNPAGKVLVDALRRETAGADVSVGSAAEGTISEKVVVEAARVFGVPVERLHLTARPHTTAGWDSFAHLALVTAIEQRFDVTLSAREVLRIDQLSDLVDILVEKEC